MRKAEQSLRATRSVPQAIPFKDVRLVFAYKDPTTGVKRDVIATKLLNGNIFHDPKTGRKRWTRYVPGLNISVPWPVVKPTKHEDHDGDTLRALVEEKTFIPSLLRPPMPSSVIDELRNKFSKFRTRHTEEYIQQKVAEEEAEKVRKESVKMMLDPMRQIRALARQQQRDERKAKGLPKLRRPKVTQAMLGQAIARVQGLSLESEPKETVALTN
jgi:large subunit ribosomal protein L24